VDAKTGLRVEAVSLASVLGKITEARDVFDAETQGGQLDPDCP
jgi:hypothetical protein